jgi:DNA polymerase-1
LDATTPIYTVRLGDFEDQLEQHGVLIDEMSAAQVDELRDVYEVDRDIIPMIARMQRVGLQVDLAHFADLESYLETRKQLNLEDIATVCGHPLNPNSGDQVADLLYDTLHLHEKAKNVRVKKTKGGRLSTNDKTLDALTLLHPIVPLIQEGRGLSKLLGTYVRPMPRLVSRDGRLHPNYRITRTDTGRLSAANPNVLAFPKRDELGKYVRDGIVAGEGRELGEWDLSQIEMCVFASDSGDERMIQLITDGVDLHTGTAAEIFGRPLQVMLDEIKHKSQKTKDQRFAAKAVNFGILMGITEFGLLDQFHKNGQAHYALDDTARLLVEWGKVYPQGKDYIETKHAEARRKGYVTDMWGRVRYLEGIHSDDEYIRKEAERMAQSTPTQSGAQGIMKRIMRALWPVLRAWRTEFWVEPLLQIHDALMLEYEQDRRAQMNDLMLAAMTGTVEIKVPIRAEATFGQRWGEL